MYVNSVNFVSFGKKNTAANRPTKPSSKPVFLVLDQFGVPTKRLAKVPKSNRIDSHGGLVSAILATLSNAVSIIKFEMQGATETIRLIEILKKACRMKQKNPAKPMYINCSFGLVGVDISKAKQINQRVNGTERLDFLNKKQRHRLSKELIAEKMNEIERRLTSQHGGNKEGLWRSYQEAYDYVTHHEEAERLLEKFLDLGGNVVMAEGNNPYTIDVAHLDFRQDNPDLKPGKFITVRGTDARGVPLPYFNTDLNLQAKTQKQALYNVYERPDGQRYFVVNGKEVALNSLPGAIFETEQEHNQTTMRKLRDFLGPNLDEFDFPVGKELRLAQEGKGLMSVKDLLKNAQDLTAEQREYLKSKEDMYVPVGYGLDDLKTYHLSEHGVFLRMESDLNGRKIHWSPDGSLFDYGCGHKVVGAIKGTSFAAPCEIVNRCLETLKKLPQTLSRGIRP